MLRDALENVLDPASLREILLIVDSSKLPKKRSCLVRYSPEGRRGNEGCNLRLAQRHRPALARLEANGKFVSYAALISIGLTLLLQPQEERMKR